MSEWREVEIGEFCTITRGGSPRPIQDYIAETGTPWVKIADAKNDGRYIKSTKEFIKKEGENKSRVVYPGDFILSNSATPGLPRFMKIRACIHDGWLLLREITGVDDIFLYYLLLTEREALLIQGNGSIFTNLKTDILKNHIVSLPPLPVQKAIAEVLSSLDDKIDLLHRQNKTLEQIAETLFRQWFLEEAQEDWEETTLGEVIRIGSGKGLKKDKFIESGKYPILGANGEIGRTDEYLFNDRLIFTGRVGTLGNVFRIESEKVWLSDNTLVIQPKKYYNFIYFVLKSAKIDQYNVGSTQPLVRQSDIKEIEIILSEDNIHAEFEIQSNVLFEKINKNQTQIRTLEKLRDTLLPKLMSGEVRVN